MFLLYKCLYFNFEVCLIFGFLNSIYIMLYFLEFVILKFKFLIMYGFLLVKLFFMLIFIYILVGCLVVKCKFLNNFIVLFGLLGICWRMRFLIFLVIFLFIMFNVNIIYLFLGNVILKVVLL